MLLGVLKKKYITAINLQFNGSTADSTLRHASYGATNVANISGELVTTASTGTIKYGNALNDFSLYRDVIITARFKIPANHSNHYLFTFSSADDVQRNDAFAAYFTSEATPRLAFSLGHGVTGVTPLFVPTENYTPISNTYLDFVFKKLGDTISVYVNGQTTPVATKTQANIRTMDISKNNGHVLQLFGELSNTNDGTCDFLTIERKV